MDEAKIHGATPEENAALLNIADNLSAVQDDDTPKHVQLRLAITETIRAGALKPGDQIPPERQLSAAVGLSLGTVQRSLGRLAADGVVVRRHGTGTFVAEPRKPSETVWQFRFFDRDGTGPLPVYAHLVDTSPRVDEPLLHKVLGRDDAGYCKISRIYSVGDVFTCFGDFFVPNSRFPDFAATLKSEKETVSFKILLERDYAAPTLSITHWVRSATLPEGICRHIDVAPNTCGLVVEVIGHSTDKEPISFQRIYVPSTEYVLDMSHQLYSNELDIHSRATRLFADQTDV